MTKTATSPFGSFLPVKAIRLPSGDQWLFHAMDEPSVICRSLDLSTDDTINRVAVQVPAIYRSRLPSGESVGARPGTLPISRLFFPSGSIEYKWLVSFVVTEKRTCLPSAVHPRLPSSSLP